MSNIFTCKYCQRTLPMWMTTGGRRCTDCSDSADTQQKIEDIRKRRSGSDTQSSRSPSKKTSRGFQRQNNEYQESPKPAVVDPSDYTESSETASNLSESIEPKSESENKIPPKRRSYRDVSKAPSVQLYHQPAKPNNHRDLPDCDVFSLGWYFKEDYQRDAYSSRLIRLCKDGELSELSFFKSRLSNFLDNRLSDDIQPDLITVFPGHNGGVSKGLATLAENVTKGRDFQYRRVLIRAEERPSQHVQPYNKRWENQRGSIATQHNIDSKTAFVLDDICTSGASMTVAKHNLMKQGADRVIGICLGLSTNQSGQYIKRMRDEEHTIESIVNG